MKAKIFGKLKQEYSSLGLGDEILMSQAEALAATGLVTDDNIDAVVAAQRTNLENLQKASDKRVTEALATARKKAEEEARKKAEEEAKAAEEARKKAEEEEKRKREQKKTGTEDDARLSALEERLSKLLKDKESEDAAHKATIDALTASKTSLEERVKALTDENEAAKAKAAKEARIAMITAKAKELGVPDWRIEEGFAIADDATDETITDTLTKAANNVQANLLPGGNSFPLKPGAEPSKDEISSLAESLIK